MLYTVILILLWAYLLAVFGVYYYRQYKQLPRKKFFSFKVLGIPIATVLVIVVPLLVINIRGERYIQDPFEAIEQGEELQNGIKILDARKELLYKDSLNLDYHFEFVKLAANLRRQSYLTELTEWYLQFKSNTDSDIADIAYLMEGFIDFYMDRPINYAATFDKVKNSDLKYLNYGYGLLYFMEANALEAENFFLKEINNKGYGFGAVAYLIEIYEYDNREDDLRALAYNELTYPYLNRTYKMNIYFEDGAWIPYYREAIDRHKEKLNFFGFIGALLASIIWILYLRNLDVFEPEKWKNIIIVFLLGALFVLLVYPMSDSLEYYFNFHYGEGWINDLLYSSIVIGLVEELIKFLPWFILLKFTRVIDEPFDYILYASLSAAGFAFAENLIYFQEVDLHIIFIRATYCIVGHMFWASIIAYSFVLYKYKYKKAKNKIYVIPLAILIASFAHGVYDFFLFKNIGLLSTVFFLGSLHLFVVFQNNALNLSDHFSYQIRLNTRKIGVMLISGLLAVFMYQYTVIGLRYGNDDANQMIRYSALSVSFMLAYLTHTFTQLNIVKGAWNSIEIPGWINLGRKSFSKLVFNEDSSSEEERKDLSGQILRFFAPKENPFVGNQLPVTGTLLHKIEVSGSDDWYLTQLNAPVVVNDCLRTTVIVRHKNKGQSLSMDKVLIYFMMIPSEYVLDNEVILTRDLIFTGRVYSRPV